MVAETNVAVLLASIISFIGVIDDFSDSGGSCGETSDGGGTCGCCYNIDGA